MTLYQILTIVGSIVLGGSIGLFIKKEKTLNILLKIMGGIVFFSFCLYLFGRANLETETGNYNDIFDCVTVSIFTGRFDGIMSRFMSLLMILIRWGNAICFVSVIVGVFYNGKGIRIINIYFLPLVVLLNMIFFKQNIYCVVGDYTGKLLYHNISFMLRTMSLAVFYALTLKKEILYGFKDITKKDYLAGLLTFVVIMAFSIPTTIFYQLFGTFNGEAKDFSPIHIFMMALTLGIILAAFFILRKRSLLEKNVFLTIISLTAFYQYFYTYFYFGIGIESYPFHICNTAVILMPIAMCFKSKNIFYFNFFINTLGAIFAIVYTNGNDFFDPEVIEYWSNHMIDVIFPFVGVALGAFKKPNFKEMLGALGIFVIYFMVAQVAGAISNMDMDPLAKVWNADFFFLYGTKFTDDVEIFKVFVNKIKYGLTSDGLSPKYVLTITIKGHTYYAYWLYSLLIFVVYSALSFLMWYVIDKYDQFVIDMKLIVYKTRLKKEKIGKTSKAEVEEIKNKMGGRTMIKISHFSKRYGSSKKYAVKDFNLTIEDGDVFGFIGHNGAGKSTVIKSLVGIQSITEGNIEICGYDIEKYPLQAKLNIGYVSDNHAVYEKLTGREYINYVADLYQVPKEVRDERIDHYATMFGLTEALDRESKSYSHGMKQKLVVISSLIHDPKVWVLDEPLTGLDPTSSYQIKECMKEHASKGNIVFFSTHVIEVIEKLCNKIAIISHGELMGVYKIEDLKREGMSLENLYLKYVVSDENRGEFKEEDIKTTDAGLILERQKNKEE